MKTSLEPEDLLAIAGAVIELIRPMLSGNGKASDPDIILTPETLAEYLKVDISWIYKQVSYKAIPYFKAGKYTRFKKPVIDKWVEGQSVNPIPPLKLVRHG